MATIILRSAIGRPLTNDEVDANFINLNTSKLETTALGSSVQPYDADLAAIAGITGTVGLLKKTAANTWSLDTSAYLTANQTVTLTGDATGSGKTNITVTLNTVAVSKGGTGRTSLTTNSLLIGNGTSAVNYVAPGSSGNLLVSNGTSWVSNIPTGQAFSRSINIYKAVDQSVIDDPTPAGLYFWTKDPRGSSVYNDGTITQISNGSDTSTIAIRIPASISGSYALTLPGDPGIRNQLLSTNGYGTLFWTDRPTRSKSYFYSSF